MSKISDTLKAGCGFECSRTETASDGKTVIHTWPPQCPDSSGRTNVTEPFTKEFTTESIVLGPTRDGTVHIGDLPETLGKGGSVGTAVVEKDMVRHPDHYDEGDPVYEPIKVIQAWKLNFAIGSAVKYLARYKKKWNPIEDLEKAKQYIDFEIEELRKQVPPRGMD